LLLLLPSVTVLGLSLWLQASPEGVGTHTQLGMSSCTMLTWTAMPCPMCGMTTTFAHLAQGQVVAGALNQPMGLVLFLLTLAAAGLALCELVRPRGRIDHVLAWIVQRDLLLASAGLVGLIGGWVYKIFWMRGVFPWSG